jgi:hypothetical protein
MLKHLQEEKKETKKEKEKLKNYIIYPKHFVDDTDNNNNNNIDSNIDFNTIYYVKFENCSLSQPQAIPSIDMM